MVRSARGFIFVFCLFIGISVLPQSVFGVSSSAAVSGGAAPDSVANLVKKFSSSVVHISVSRRSDSMHSKTDGTMSEMIQYREISGQFWDPRRLEVRSSPVHALGSGFVIDRSGLIVTNNHVVDSADEVFVSFQDGSRLKAEILGRDEKTDLAVLRVRSDRPFTAIQFSDESKLQSGDWVIAMGNPFGSGPLVSVGVISALHSGIRLDPYDDFIQVDSVINLGNAGGPLFDMAGNLVGIGSALSASALGLRQAGFAVPAYIARRVISHLIEFGEVRRSSIGVRIQPVTPAIAASLELKEPRGVLVSAIISGSPVSEVGLQVGDVIIQLGDHSIYSDSPNFLALVANLNPDKEVDVVVLRKGIQKSFKIIPIRLGDEGKKITFTSSDSSTGKRNKRQHLFGAELADLDIQIRRQFNIARNIDGVAVVLVDSDSPLLDKGVLPGNVIVQMSFEPVRTEADIVEQLENLRKRGRKFGLMLVSNGVGETRFVPVPVPPLGE